MVARRGNHPPRGVSVVADKLDPIQPEQARDLVDDGREDPLGCGAGGDECGDPSERSLLVAEATEPDALQLPIAVAAPSPS